jgi:hypothetical protein
MGYTLAPLRGYAMSRKLSYTFDITI